MCLPAIVSLGACSQAESDKILSAEINAAYTLSSNTTDSTATCSAYLTVGSGGIGATLINLSATDTLTCTDGTETATLTGSAGDYDTDNLDKETNQSYTFKLARTNVGNCGHSEELTSTVTLPPLPILTAPTASATLSKASGFSILWTAGSTATDTISATLTSSTVATEGSTDIGSASWSSQDDGSILVSPSELTNFRAGSAKLLLMRSRSGIHSSILKGSIRSTATAAETTVTVAN